MKNFFAEALGKAHHEDPNTDEGVDDRPTSAHHWLEYAMRRPSARELRRRHKAQVDRNTKHHAREQRRSWREQRRFNQKTAVTVLRAYESELGHEPGGLRAELVDAGKLEAVRSKTIGYVPEQREVDGEMIDVLVPVLKDVPIGHRPSEILAAAGLDEKAIQEINERVSA